MNRVIVLTLAMVLGFAMPLLAIEKQVRFEWNYPQTENTIIEGFRIYDITDHLKPKLVVTIKQSTIRVYERKVDLKTGKNFFYVVPFIGDYEGEPSELIEIDVSPFTKVTGAKGKLRN